MDTDDASDSWHFARPELAQKYLTVFETGLISAQALFAPRRMGKSEFLGQDLIPAAQTAGYRAAYLNLWDQREHPRRALIKVLSEASGPRAMDALLKRFKQPLKKLKAGAKIAGVEGSLEAELADDSDLAPLALTELLHGFDRSTRKLLLVLDEAQILAAAASSTLAHSLRAGLDVRKQFIKVIFAGSSESSLRSMFARPTEPFYNWAPIDPFERLGDEFVVAMTRRVNKLSRHRLTEKEAMHAFDVLKRTPEFFRRYLQRYLLNADLGSQAALDHTAAHVFDNSDFRALWNRLLPADRAILRALSQGAGDLYSLQSRTRLAQDLGLVKPVPNDTPKNALRRLQKQELIVRMDQGHYRLQDDAFAEWVRERELDD